MEKTYFISPSRGQKIFVDSSTDYMDLFSYLEEYSEGRLHVDSRQFNSWNIKSSTSSFNLDFLNKNIPEFYYGVYTTDNSTVHYGFISFLEYGELNKHLKTVFVFTLYRIENEKDAIEKMEELVKDLFNL